MYRIVQKRNIFFTLSLVLVIPGLVAWAVWGLRLGIDFTGGTLLRGSFAETVPSTADLEKAVRDTGVSTVHVQTSESKGIILRMEHITNEQHDTILAALQKQDPTFAEASFETIGPTIGAELKRKAIVATILVLALIVVYVTWAFRKVSAGPVPSWVYGASAIIALIHDVGIVIGVFAILGHFGGVEVDALFVTALLTVLGFSVH
ncbi:MAG: protein translocase subunit SecF, partial [Patescibacteria group bacterium]